jgi:uracil-DNA glycosylase
VAAAATAGALAGPLRGHFDAVSNDWAPLLQAFAGSPAGRALCSAVDARQAAGARIYPPDPFLALRLTPAAQVRAVVLGQDPYHGPGQAEGLAFSVAPGLRWPPSLRNILQEWQRDLGQPLPVSGSLRPWAGQGVLLLNTALTVEDGQPGAHAALGWQLLTQRLVQALVGSAAPSAFLLWGAHAQAYAPLVQAAGRHLLLCCNHPSPLAARRPPVPFVGCGHFSAAQRFLEATGRGRLGWSLA